MINKIFIFFYSIICAFSLKTEACSTFLLEKEHQFLLAKSYDWIVEDGLVIVNKRHIAKQAMTLDHPMQWASKYGSIIFTQAGRELPMGGMNETGLTIELMWLDDTIYPLPDSRSTIYELQWIQYQLDTACSVEEVLSNDKILRIDGSSKSLIHFIIVDNTGNSAIIEFIDGKMVVYDRSKMQTPVLTNNTYQKSLEFLKEHQGFGGEKKPLEGFESLDRFVRLSTLLQKFSSSTDSADTVSAFRILSNVANFGETSEEEASFENIEQLIRAKWNIVYDISHKEIHFITGSHQKVRTIRLNAFNFDGDTDVQVLDVQAQLVGDVSLSFIPYSYELNRNLIDRYYGQVPFLKELSDEIRELTARYPETTYYVGRH
jgi:penicillin V acylase-like amidase (Ntn superfamily)